ncbi:MAG: entericidin A/B family lipoprotein [Georgfuchsia sp.]
MKNLKTILVLLGLGSVLLTGCNTLRGMGQDIEKGGEAIQKAANK